MPQDLWRILTSPQARKLQLALFGFVAAAVSAGLFPPSIALWISLGLSALTAAGVYVVPNTDAAVLPPEARSVPAHRAEPVPEPFYNDTPAVG